LATQQDRDRDRRSNDAGKRQRDTNTNRPWGVAKAAIPMGEGKDPLFVLVGAVWETQNGNLKINLDAEPNQWRDPHCRRSLVLLKNDERK